MDFNKICGKLPPRTATKSDEHLYCAGDDDNSGYGHYQCFIYAAKTATRKE